MVELPVARVDDRPLRGVDGHADRVGDAVADVVRVAAERADAERRPRRDLDHDRLVGELVLAELRADEPERELRAVNRHVREVAQDVRQRADVILVRVRDEDPFDLVAALAEVLDVGDDEVDAEHLLVGEHEPGVDDQDVVALLDRHHVLPDLTDTAERDDADRASQGASSAPPASSAPVSARPRARQAVRSRGRPPAPGSPSRDRRGARAGAAPLRGGTRGRW